MGTHSPRAPWEYTEGKEGPGSYGLNRNVTLTILVGKEGKVTANFALVQPSTQADLPKILEEVAKVAGGPVAKAEHLIVAEVWVIRWTTCGFRCGRSSTKRPI